jgi:hypothetical protein
MIPVINTSLDFFTVLLLKPLSAKPKGFPKTEALGKPPVHPNIIQGLGENIKGTGSLSRNRPEFPKINEYGSVHHEEKVSADIFMRPSCGGGRCLPVGLPAQGP